MAEPESRQSQDTGLDFLSPEWSPVVSGLHLCPHCGQQIEEGNAYWVIESRDEGFYTPYCNEFHWMAYHKIGVFEEEKERPI